MRVTRREFLAAGAAGAVLATSGCGRPGEAWTEAKRWWGKPTASRLPERLTAPASAEIDLAAHVLNRLTFGARPGDHARVTALGVEAFLEEQLAPERIADEQCERVIRHGFESLAEPAGTLFARSGEAEEPLQRIFPTMKDGGARVGHLYEFKDKVLLDDLTRATVLRAVLSERQLFEVMVQFWSDHFNIDPSKADAKWLKAADDRDTIRAHALGKFSALLRASAVSPAMLWYLDGRANRRAKPGDRPNENYARELLELHTLGVRGGYTQHDVMETARCLTGWTVREKKRFFRGRVEFRARDHDDGPKRVLGTEIPAGLGARDLDRVLEILTAHPSTARHLAEKLCRKFIADEPPAAAVAATAAEFARTGGDIAATLRVLFATEEFRTPDVRGAKLKRPFHFVVSALRAANAETDARKPLVDHLVRLGHAPFRYATPDGYPETEEHWRNGLLWRWNFAAALGANRIKGTRSDAAGLARRLGGDEALMATVLGRRPTEDEREAYRESGDGLALLLATPAFQRC